MTKDAAIAEVAAAARLFDAALDNGAAAASVDELLTRGRHAESAAEEVGWTSEEISAARAAAMS